MRPAPSRRLSTFHGLSAALALFCMSLAPHAHAETSSENQAAAEALFVSGMKAMEAGDFETACGKFKKSHALDPAVGTLLNLARCYTDQGKLASAWSTYREAASMARQAGQLDREEHARAQAEALEPRLSKIEIVVAESVARLEGLQVEFDGRAVDSVMFGEALPVDAGAHEVRVSAPGYETLTLPVAAPGEGQTSPVNVESLEPTGGSDDRAEAPAEVAEKDSGKSSVGPWILGGVGVAAAGFGTAMLFVAKGHDDDARAICTDPAEACTEAEETAWNDSLDKAKSSATMGYIGLGVGGAALAGAVIWYVVGKPKDNTVGTHFLPLVSPSVFGFSARGSF